MGTIKWLVIFLAAFLFAWILIFTFTQEPFKALVSAMVFSYKTPPVPIYVYVAGAFGAGLFIGLGSLVYNYVRLRSRIHRKGKQIRDLEKELETVRAELENYQRIPETTEEAGKAPEGETL